MKKNNYNFDDLFIQLRLKDIRSIEEVEYAILETNGQLSIFTKETSNGYFPIPLLISGSINKKALVAIGKDVLEFQSALINTRSEINTTIKSTCDSLSEQYKDYDNILYEIMNEPCGTTTWEDCKKYANEVIPIIRKNTDAIVLVGNPLWTADLISVMNSPLEGYENIMYTYHFYAADHKNTSEVEQAYDKGFPVFISEHGGMLSSGDGELDIEAVTNWYKVLDERNISYVAWNISNSKGAASIFKNGSADMTDVSDENLKEWGVYLKNWYRSKSGLDKLKDE